MVIESVTALGRWLGGLSPLDWVFFWLPFEWPTRDLVDEWHDRRRDLKNWEGIDLVRVGRYWSFQDQEWIHGGFFPDFQPRIWKVAALAQLWDKRTLWPPHREGRPLIGPIQKRVELTDRWHRYWNPRELSRWHYGVGEIFWRGFIQWGWLEGAKAMDVIFTLAAWKAARSPMQTWKPDHWHHWIYLLESV